MYYINISNKFVLRLVCIVMKTDIAMAQTKVPDFPPIFKEISNFLDPREESRIRWEWLFFKGIDE